MKELASLTLKKAGIADDGLPFLKKLPAKLRYLNLSGNYLSRLGEALDRLTKLRVLILSDNPLEWANMEASQRSLREVRRFEIARANAGGEITRAIRWWIHLKRLDISGNPLMKWELEEILRTNRGFESLNLSSLNLTDQALPLLEGQIRLRRLNLSGNLIGAGILSLLANQKSLEALSLQECGLNGEAVAEILLALFGNNSLKELDLRGNGASYRFFEIRKLLSIPDLRLPEYSLARELRELFPLWRLRGASEVWCE